MSESFGERWPSRTHPDDENVDNRRREGQQHCIGIVCEACHEREDYCSEIHHPHWQQNVYRRLVNPACLFFQIMMFLFLLNFLMLLFVTPEAESDWICHSRETRRLNPGEYLKGALPQSLRISSNMQNGVEVYYFKRKDCPREVRIDESTDSSLDLWGSLGRTRLDYILHENSTLEVGVHIVKGRVFIHICRKADLFFDPYGFSMQHCQFSDQADSAQGWKQINFTAPSTDAYVLIFHYDDAMAYGNAQITKREVIQSFSLDTYKPTCVSLPGSCIVKMPRASDCIIVRNPTRSHVQIHVESIRSWYTVMLLASIPLLLGLAVRFTCRKEGDDQVSMVTTPATAAEATALLRTEESMSVDSIHAVVIAWGSVNYQSNIIVVPAEFVTIESESPTEYATIESASL
jgi:hypothetical protein